MAARVTIHWHANELGRSPNDPIGRTVNNISNDVANAAKVHAPRVSGHLANSITARMSTRGGVVRGQVSASAPYASFVHNGTGLYGPRRERIQAPHGRYFAFRGHGGMVYVTSTRGQKPQPFLVQGLRDVVGPNIHLYTLP
jgi:hypothetical protein